MSRDSAEASLPRQRALAYLHAHHVMTLATCGSDGPWAAPVFYACDGATLLFLTAQTTRHGRDLAADARVAAAVTEDYSEWSEIRGVQLEGLARALDGAERDAAIALFAQRHPVVRQPLAVVAQALLRVTWYRLTPSRLFFCDNSQGFGHRDDIILNGF
jgi:hypothetical protein